MVAHRSTTLTPQSLQLQPEWMRGSAVKVLRLGVPVQLTSKRWPRRQEAVGLIPRRLSQSLMQHRRERVMVPRRPTCPETELLPQIRQRQMGCRQSLRRLARPRCAPQQVQSAMTRLLSSCANANLLSLRLAGPTSRRPRKIPHQFERERRRHPTMVGTRKLASDSVDDNR